ncbi:hypothetical protein [Paracidovorax wautersii]|uniref:hypothetical protein n=1 Tax=Paracidovorax wautersii TaxID=1177982 RepID=UPI0011146614|nr:hypothetical protein [Paracidovorax wautersii]
MTNPLFRDRVPEAAAQQLATALAWLTECQLATLEGMKLVKRTPKSELARQQQICDRAVAQCKDLGVTPVGPSGDACIRLSGRLASVAEGGRHEPVAEPGSWLSDIKRLVESNRLPDEDFVSEDDLDRHAEQIAAQIEAILMSLPVDQRELAIHSGRDWLIEAGAWTPKSFARAYGIVLGAHVCEDKYGIERLASETR